MVASRPYGFLVSAMYQTTGVSDSQDIVGRWVVPGADEAVGQLFALDEEPWNQGFAALACAGESLCLLAEVHTPGPYATVDNEGRARFVHPTLFADGFDAGDRSAWSANVPCRGGVPPRAGLASTLSRSRTPSPFDSRGACRVLGQAR